MAHDKVERITAKGVDVWISRPANVDKMNTSSRVELIRYNDLKPPNMLSQTGETLKLLVGDGLNVELSKRRSPMTFWHRNMEFDEVIICVKGEARWMTEMGDFNVKAGEMLFIPRGIAHTASADQNSDYMAIELKSRQPLTLAK